MTRLRAISWEQRLLGVLTPVLHSGKQAGAGCGNPKEGRMALRASCASSSRRSPVPTIYSSDPELQQWSTVGVVARGRRPEGQAP